VNSVRYNPEKDVERLQDVLLNLLLFLKFNLMSYDINLSTPYSYLMLGQLVFNPTMIRPIWGLTDSSIPIVWFLNTPVFTQLNLCSSSMILFYSTVIINLLYNQSLTLRPEKTLVIFIGSRKSFSASVCFL